MDGEDGVLEWVADDTPTRKSLVEGKFHPLTVVVRPEQARAGDGWWKSSGDPGIGLCERRRAATRGEKPPGRSSAEATDEPILSTSVSITWEGRQPRGDERLRRADRRGPRSALYPEAGRGGRLPRPVGCD